MKKKWREKEGEGRGGERKRRKGREDQTPEQKFWL